MGWFDDNADPSDPPVTTGATTQPTQAVAGGNGFIARGDPSGSGATPGNPPVNPFQTANGTPIQAVWPSNAGPAPAGYTTNPTTGNAALLGTPPAAAATDSGYPGLSAADKATIDGYLAKAQSTDDPTYWYNLAVQHGGVANTGADWLQGRIAQGDGAAAVKNGTVQKFQDTPAANPLDSSLLAPYTKTFDYAPFTAPTGANESNDPGFQQRLDTGTQALQRSAAGRGTLLTGGTAKDLQQFGQDYASNEYSNVYNRAAQDYNTNRNNAYQQYLGDESTFYANQNNPFAKLLSLSTLDQQGQIANNNLGLGYAQLNSGNTNTNNMLGYDYTALGVNNLNQGANAYGNYTTGAGNASAAGTVGGANAWQNAFGGIGNTALGAAYANYLKPSQPTSGQQPYWMS